MQIAAPTDDDFLLDDGLPCLRRDGRLYYLNDVQPRVLEACRIFEIGFDQLVDKLGMGRPALVLILKGYDPVPPQLKSMLDRLLGQAGLLGPMPADCRIAETAAARSAPPVSTTIHAVPVPEPPRVATAEPVVTVPAEEMPADESMGGDTVVIPQPLAPGRPAMPVSPIPVPPAVFTAGLSDYTPGLRRVPRRRSTRPRI